MTVINDAEQRQRALDPQQSFIVQAPAGSGKTELLTQRYLRLLAQAKKGPEEIVAITFTRKAAAEMRERVLSALTLGQQLEPPPAAYQRTTWQLARQVLAASQQQSWQLLSNPNRLRIMTIDALAAFINAQIPLLAGFGSQPAICEDAKPYYRLAVTQLLQSAEHLATHRQSLQTLLLHLNNDADRLADLLVDLLAKRDQWLLYVVPYYQATDALRPMLEQALTQLALEQMAHAKACLPASLESELLTLNRYAAKHLQDNPKPNNTKIAHNLNVTKLATDQAEHLMHWQSLAELLLTKDHQWRKTVNASSGFPAPSKAATAALKTEYQAFKSRMLACLEQLTAHTEFKHALIDIITCPPVTYKESQWSMIQALFSLLPTCVAELHVIFKRYAIIDFTEQTFGALRALGDDEAVTDLALYLDYAISHILVDEFQDTAISQYKLLEKLTHGWEPGDGRSIFLVGDPMQSIYRFRRAEVGLFLRAQQYGLGLIPLVPLTLNVNFRSQAAVVNWVNQHFARIFPAQADRHAGAVPYSASQAFHQDDPHAGIHYHALVQANDAQQAQLISQLIKQYQQRNSDASIAILVRTRSRLDAIINALHQAHINFLATDIEPLNKRPEVIDALSLTQALLHLADKVAWLAVLRAPWCGLCLADLHILAQQCWDKPLFTALIRPEVIQQLSEDGQQRLQKLVPILETALLQRDQQPLASWIKAVWLAIGGPACLSHAYELSNTTTYFQLLDSMTHDFSLEALDNQLAQLYAKSQGDQQAKVQIMTIHKAKGLEFDHVILPSLNRPPNQDQQTLLMWLERPTLVGKDDLILAPIASYADKKADPIQQFIRQTETQKLTHESARLFYVAVTRAKKTLDLVALLDHDENSTDHTIKPPKARSLLSLLWPTAASEFKATAQAATAVTQVDHSEPARPALQRLPLSWQCNYPITPTAKVNSPNTAYLRPPQSECATHIGTVIHWALQQLSCRPLTSWNEANINSLKQQGLYALQNQGLNTSQLALAEQRLSQAIANILADPRGQWILSSTHIAAASELKLSVAGQAKVSHLLIDRTFIDAEQRRWIIDYKTTLPDTKPLNDFIQAQQQQHFSQLQQYAKVISSMEPNDIMLALYFPLIPSWCAWRYQPAADLIT